MVAFSEADAWAVGLTTRMVDDSQDWDGQAWSVVDSPNGDPDIPNGTFAAVDPTSATDAWAVGTYAPGLQERAEPLLAHRDGRAWTAVPGPDLLHGHTRALGLPGYLAGRRLLLGVGDLTGGGQ